MSLVLNGTTGITNPGAYTGDGVSFADGTPSNTLVTTTGGNVGIGTSSPGARLSVVSSDPSGTGAQFSSSTSSTAILLNANFNETDRVVTLRAGFIGGSAPALAFNIGSPAAERMRIDSAGNVGIGTSSPSGRLHVTWSANAATGGMYLRNTNSSSNAYAGIYFGNDASAEDAFIGSLSSTNTAYGGARSFLLGSNSSAPVVFMTGGAERARIDSSGNLLVGTTSGPSDTTFTVVTSGSRHAGNFENNNVDTYSTLTVKNLATSGTRRLIDFRNSSNTTVGAITHNGTATTYATSSDYRLKHDIQPMTGALAKVQQLKPVTYKWNADDSQSQGFIAHELQEVVPECVTGEKDAVDADGNPQYQGIDTSFLAATMVAAIQELKAELDTVKAELATLKGATE
jgi:hypothetical protein